MLVAILTEEQKDLLIGNMYADASYFYPIQDADENWIISTEEINYNVNSDFFWIKDLPLIDFKAPKTEDFINFN
jgi:hypothetical protein